MVEEFVCAKIVPLKADQSWFDVKDNMMHRGHGLKGLGINIKQAWSRVLQKSSYSVAGVKAIYREVAEATEEIVGSLGSAETKAIRVALADRHRVN